MEEIYSLCLKSLINGVKNCLHSEKLTFRKYISRCIEKSIIKYIAKIEHISYNEAWNKIYEDKYSYNNISIQSLSALYHFNRNNSYDVDFIKNISSEEFMIDYNNVVNSLDDLSLKVIKLLYDSEGNPGLTYNEISEYLGISTNKIASIKKKALKKLRNDETIKKFIL